jgi:hypothetical protein
MNKKDKFDIDAEHMTAEMIMHLSKTVKMLKSQGVHEQLAAKSNRLLEEGSSESFDKMIDLIRQIQATFPKENPAITFATFFAVYNNMILTMPMKDLPVTDAKRMDLLHEGRSTVPVAMAFAYLFTSLLTEHITAGKE